MIHKLTHKIIPYKCVKYNNNNNNNNNNTLTIKSKFTSAL